MSESPKNKKYDLEDRTLAFAKNIRSFLKMVPKTLSSIEDGKQLVRSSGSIGANFIEANESLSRKDFAMRVKICRKESKESIYWLKLLVLEKQDVDSRRLELIQEATELMKIFGAILEKCK